MLPKIHALTNISHNCRAIEKISTAAADERRKKKPHTKSKGISFAPYENII